MTDTQHRSARRSCITGLQWGDEGKGKITDVIAPEYDVVVRYQGGANAGHTVKVGNEVFKLNLLPSGIIHPGKRCLIGSGVAVDFGKLAEETAELGKRGIDVLANLRISEIAPVVLPLHKLMDRAVEDLRAEEAIGTTHRGSGPCYAARAYRIGLRVGDFHDVDVARKRLGISRRHKLSFLEEAGITVPSVDAMLAELMTAFDKVKSMILTASAFIAELEADKPILFEGAQGTLLDVDFGTYPFVTSSHTISGALFSGLGIPPQDVHVLGVAKAYCTRVGAGPFPTEDGGEAGARIANRGQEFGTTTGRPRRCGWLDVPALRHAVRINRVDEIALTKIDILSGFKSIKVCTSYKGADGPVTRFPLTAEAVSRCEPVYEEWPGWDEELDNISTFAGLPENARSYIARLSALLETPITRISIGPKRHQILDVPRGA
jgi:adenylosuccinate synthase